MNQHGQQTGSRLGWFTSRRERRLWTWALVVVSTIYLTLGLAGALAGLLGDQGLNAATFVLGGLLILSAIVTQSARRRLRRTELFVTLGVAAIYVLVFTRLTSPVERSHLMEYGVVAILLYQALKERASNGSHVPRPALMAMGITAVVGAIDEFIQAPLPSRVFDPVDIGFNAAAAIIAIVASLAMEWAQRRRTRTG